MSNTVKSWLRVFFTLLGRAITPLFFKVTVKGREHLPPPTTRPLILVANHFSWFDAPLISLYLRPTPAFIVAIEATKMWWWHFFLKIFRAIPIWRGQVDRTAFKQAKECLQEGIVLGVFPEGGMNPDNAARLGRGEQIHDLGSNITRAEGILAEAKPGVALLALQNDAYILPVAIQHSERIIEHLRRWRRAPITIHIGPVFGPLELDESLRGRARRAQLNELSQEMMRHVALLLPPAQRGPYAESTAVSNVGKPA